jgi:hypothetical protein
VKGAAIAPKRTPNHRKISPSEKSTNNSRFNGCCADLPYLLTPTGVSEKAALTRRFLQRKMAEYEKLQGEIEALQFEAEPPISTDAGTTNCI